jgi:signal transduction histidine kinase
LEQLVARRTRELATAFEFSQEIVSQFDLEQLRQSVVERARSLTGAQAVALCLLGDGQDALTLVFSTRNGHLNLRQPIQRDPALQVVSGGRTVVTQTERTQCAFLTAHTPGECAIAPLRAGKTTLGGLCVVRLSKQAFDEDETRALTLLANSAAIAIANARLVESGRRQAELSAAQAERERLSAELHDNLAQTLSFLMLKVESVKKLLVKAAEDQGVAEIEKMRTAIEGAYEQVRMALVGLNDPLPKANHFHKKLVEVLETARQQTGIEIQLQADEMDSIDLPELAQAQALYILREALANASRHARAQRVWVRVELDNHLACLSIEDDGCGFDPQAVVGSHHLGLRMMRARAERSGGSLTVESAPGEGTRVIAWLPLSPERTSP